MEKRGWKFYLFLIALSFVAFFLIQNYSYFLDKMTGEVIGDSDITIQEIDEDVDSVDDNEGIGDIQQYGEEVLNETLADIEANQEPEEYEDFCGDGYCSSSEDEYDCFVDCGKSSNEKGNLMWMLFVILMFILFLIILILIYLKSKGFFKHTVKSTKTNNRELTNSLNNFNSNKSH